MHLIAQIKRLNLGQELGFDSIDAMLDVVASGEEWPITVPPLPEVRRVAAPAGSPGQTVTDAAPPIYMLTPVGSVSSVPVPPVVRAVYSFAQEAQGLLCQHPPLYHQQMYCCLLGRSRRLW